MILELCQIFTQIAVSSMMVVNFIVLNNFYSIGIL